jgi:hypothetical protein
MKFGVDRIRVDPGQSSLPGSRWTPEDERKYVPLFDRQPQRLSFTDKMLLSCEFVEIARSYSVGERFHYVWVVIIYR